LDASEIILAQEQGASMRSGGAKKEVEAEFGVGSKEGTLILTNRRLIFVCTNDRGEDLPVGYFGDHLLVYSEVEDLDSIPPRSPNVFIPLQGASVRGHKEGIGRPNLEVTWKDGDRNHTLVFTETMIGRRAKNLNDWAQVIAEIKEGTQKFANLPAVPATDTLEGKIMHVLADMQEKGILDIEEDVEGEYGLDLDPDEVQNACDRLASQGLLIRLPDSSGDTFYRRASQLGEDLSN
jgi:hypothetical protein